MQAAVIEASLRAAAHAIVETTDGTSEQATRAAVKSQGLARRILDASGRLAAGVARTALADAMAPEAFDAAVFSVSKLLATAWRVGESK